jgi:uncharacterized protein YndB with AHSA1/START domain
LRYAHILLIAGSIPVVEEDAMLVRISVDIDTPPEVVWASSVESEKAKQWFTALTVYE